MILYINTIKDNAEKIDLRIINNDKVIVKKELSARAQQAEKLIPAISKVLAKAKIDLKEIKKITVENFGGSFTSLRIGVATANALAYSLCIPVEGINKTKIANCNINVVEPIYSKNPDITVSKKLFNN